MIGEPSILPPYDLLTRRPGAALVFGGQVVRTLAMATAAQSFTHFVSSSKKDDHVLVTHGIYSWSRHPSYVAFFYWAVGTQVLLANPVAAIGFARVLWTFFNSRIQGHALLSVPARRG